MLKQYICNRIIMPLKDPEKARKYAVGLPKGIIMAGPPGVGKTYFAEAVAKELGLAMVKLSPADLFRGIVGESQVRPLKRVSGKTDHNAAGKFSPCSSIFRRDRFFGYEAWSSNANRQRS